MINIKTYKIKTIDITAKEWFDKVNGNSYFSATITLNYGMEDSVNLLMPFQYGYGDHYVDMANEALMKAGYIPEEKRANGSRPPLWQYCKDNKIILRAFKKENCKKKEL